MQYQGESIPVYSAKNTYEICMKKKTGGEIEKIKKKIYITKMA